MNNNGLYSILNGMILQSLLRSILSLFFGKFQVALLISSDSECEFQVYRFIKHAGSFIYRKLGEFIF